MYGVKCVWGGGEKVLDSYVYLLFSQDFEEKRNEKVGKVRKKIKKNLSENSVKKLKLPLFFVL